MPKLFTLTERLALCASFVDNGAKFIDIGTDHGYLPIYLLKSGKAKTACAADIRVGPLDNARENILSYDVECECVLSDGFKNICKKYSLACICGMGGETIINIITEGKDITPDTLILQPMTGADKLRKFLYENGYSITDENFVTEGEKVYCIIKAFKTGENTPYTYPDLFLGQIRPETEGYKKWKEKIRLQAEKRLLGGRNKADEQLCNEE